MRKITLKCKEMSLNMLKIVLKDATKCPSSANNAIKMSLRCEKNICKICEKMSLKYAKNLPENPKKCP